MPIRKPCVMETETTGIGVLAVTPLSDDYDALQGILAHPKWNLLKAGDFSSAVMQLRTRRPISLVVCDNDLLPGKWKEVLSCLRSMSEPPLLIVTSRLADEHLWAEALNLGAYDVLATPFDTSEVDRSLTSAWMRWRDDRGQKRPRIMAASGM